MAYEKRLKPVPLQLFTADGTSDGKITVPDACAFKVKQQVVLNSTTAGLMRLEVKRVETDFVMYVGPISDHQHKSNILDRSDISAYLVADGASIYADEQKRPNIPEQEIERLTYEEEPTVARRTILVDECGDKIGEGNPLPVQIDTTINIGDVRITACDNDPNPGNVHSSVRISDCENELAINPDGSINVVIPPGGGGIPINDFNEISSVASGALTTISTYVVPPPFSATLFRVEVGGNNAATYELYINSVLEARHRTWFSGDLTGVIEFSSGASGFKLVTGDIIEVKVIHDRPFAGDFESRIQLQLT